MKRLIIMCACTYFILFFLINYALGDSRYIIEDVLIQIDSTNTADIRNNAIAQAQLVAYKRMIMPIIHPDEYNKIFPIDKLGINGSYIESQAFAYLAVRSYLKLPISFPETTGCKEACSGGVIIENF